LNRSLLPFGSQPSKSHFKNLNGIVKIGVKKIYMPSMKKQNCLKSAADKILQKTKHKSADKFFALSLA
jgi:hypothetical protein